MGDLLPRLEPIVAQIRARRPVRTGSLVITVMGDIVVPRGGVVWLGSLVDLLAPFGINHGQVRTAVMRLRGEQWLTRQPHGRRSFVGLTEQGRRRLDEACSRIYGDEPEPWDGGWTILLFPGGLAHRDPIRAALGWLGFGTLNHRVFLHPTPDRRALRSVLDDAHGQLSVENAPIVIEGASPDRLDPAPPSLATLVGGCWSLEPLQASYERFLTRFGPIADALGSRAPIPPTDAVLLRIALVHEYRRLLLRDPRLPPALLPEGWVGQEARQLVAFVYRVILAPAEAWLRENLEGPDGQLRPTACEMLVRFRQ